MDIIQALRSDQAGETGAVWIYRAMQLFRHDSYVTELIQEHLEQESKHLDEINKILDKDLHSRLVPLWAVAGFVTGFIPAVLGSNWIYHTIDAVETFVDKHYLDQIEYLNRTNLNLNGINVKDKQELLDTLKQLRIDEIRHRQDAVNCVKLKPSGALKIWCAMVSAGSKHAVKLAARF